MLLNTLLAHITKKSSAAWVVFLLTAVLNVSFAQQAESSTLLGTRLHHGFILVHSKHLVPIRNSFPSGLEINYAKHHTSQSAWESCLCYPKIGYNLFLWDYDQPDILGYGVIANFFVEPVFGAHRRASFSLRGGFGFSYQSKPYDAVSNPLNLSYSTYLAFAPQIGCTINYRIGQKTMLNLSALYSHISNGGVREPNKGINWPTASIGVDIYLSRPNFEQKLKNNWRENTNSKNRFDITAFIAFKEPKSKLYLFSPGLEVKYSRQVGRSSAMTIGGEWVNDHALRYRINEAGRDDSPQRIGVAIGHEFLLGRFFLGKQMGVYTWKPFPLGADLYQRYSLMYRQNSRMQYGGSLKAHGAVADFIDFRATFSISR